MRQLKNRSKLSTETICYASFKLASFEIYTVILEQKILAGKQKVSSRTRAFVINTSNKWIRSHWPRSNTNTSHSPPCYVGLSDSQHVDGGLVEAQEDSIVDLTQAEQLHYLAWPGVDTIDTESHKCKSSSTTVGIQSG